VSEKKRDPPIPLSELDPEADRTPVDKREQLNLLACFERILELHNALAVARDFIARLRREHSGDCARRQNERASVCGCGASAWNAVIDEVLERTKVPTNVG